MSGESGAATLERSIIAEDNRIEKATDSPSQDGVARAVSTAPAAVREISLNASHDVDATDTYPQTEVTIDELKRRIDILRVRQIYDGEIDLTRSNRPGQTEYVALHQSDPLEFYEPEFFTGLDQSIALQLIEEGKATKVSRAIRYSSFKPLGADVARGLIKAYCGDAVIEHLDKYEGLHLDEFVDDLLNTHQGEELTANWDKFGALDSQHVLEKLQETEQYRAIAAGLEHFPTVDQKWLVDKLFERAQSDAITEYLTGFSAIDRKELFDKLLATGSTNEILKQMQLGRISDDDKKAYAFFLLDKDDDSSYQRINSASKFFQDLGIEQVIADKLLRAGHLTYLPAEWKDKYSFSSEQLRSLESRYLQLSDDEYSKYISLVAKLPIVERPRATGEAIEILGSRVTRDNARFFFDILSGTIDEETKVNLGIDKVGEVGIAELKQSLGLFVAEVRSLNLSDETLDKIEKNPIVLEIFKGITRYDSSKWGLHTDSELINLLRYHRATLRDGRIKEMPDAYQPSGVLEIAKLNAQKERPQWTDDLLLRYDTLRTELQAANSALGEPRPFSLYFNELREQIENMVGNMRNKLEAGGLSARAAGSIQERIQELVTLITPTNALKKESYPLRSFANFEQNFHSLARHTELHSSMRKLVFAWVLRSHPEWQQQIATLGDVPSIDDVSTTREFIEHIVNQETFHDYFVDKKDARLFGGLTSTKALEEALLRIQGVGVSQDTTQVQFVPTRGVMMELSGHIADACWASKYDSMAEVMPNMTAVVMKQNPSDPEREKLIGAGMLIETTSSTGEPILLIRGLNPIENYINHVSVEEFYNQFIGYARGIAERGGRKLAIVIDDRSGDAATNRPVLFGFLSAKKPSLEKVRVNEQDTTFNGYNITNDTYFV